LCKAHEQPADAADGRAHGDSPSDDGADRTDARACDDHLAASAPAELIAVPPGGELRSEWLTDAHELRSVAKSGKSDLIRRSAQSRTTIEPLGVLDGFPTFFERREVPSLAGGAHDPQPTFGCVECEPATDREMLDGLVMS
jgi:hypothetical protein